MHKPTKVNENNKRDQVSTPVREGVATRSHKSDSGTPAAPTSILKNRGEDVPIKSPQKKKSKQGRARSSSKTPSTKTPRGRTGSTDAKGAKAGRSKSRDTSKTRSRSKSASRNTKTSKSTKQTPGKSPATYAEKTKTPPKSTPKKVKRLKHKMFIQGTVSARKSTDLRHDVYRTLGSVLSTIQSVQGAKSSRILNYSDIDETPLSSATQMPSQHTEVCKFFYFPGSNRQWNGNTIPEGRTRKIDFSCYLESDVEIPILVDAVQIDIMDLQVYLEVKTCQSISHESSLHLVRIYNKYNRGKLENDLQWQLQKFQEECHAVDPDSFLGVLQDTGIPFPKLVLKKDYPFNGPYEKTRDGVDTSYKRMWIVEYSTSDKEHVETGFKEFKKAGLLQKYWGQHANFHFAPSKDDEITPKTTLDKWYSICESHNATMLSMGMLRLDDIKNPDVEVPITYWKKSKAGQMDMMSLRDMLHSVEVPSPTDPGKKIQVLHGLCRTPDGGYETATADTNLQAKTVARNIGAHACGWVKGYMEAIGVKRESVTALLRQSFSTAAIVSAQNSKWDKKTGQVTSEAVDDIEMELRAVESSWVDMSFVRNKGATTEDARLQAGDMAAFPWEDGASVNTLHSAKSGDGSDGESSFVESSDEDSDEESDGESKEDSDGSDEEVDGDEDFGSAKSSQGDDDSSSLSLEDTADIFGMNEDEEEANTEDLEWPIKQLFGNEEVEQKILLDLVATSKIPEEVQQKSVLYTRLVAEEENLYAMQSEIYSEFDAETPEFQAKMEKLTERHGQNQTRMKEVELHLVTALRNLARDAKDDVSAQQKHSVGFQAPLGNEVSGESQNTTEDHEMEEVQDTPMSDAAGQNATAMESVDNSQGNAGRANG